MKNTVAPEQKPVSQKTEKQHVQPVRVSDMGMGAKASKEVEKKLPTAASV